MSEPREELQAIERAATELVPELAARLHELGLGEIEVRRGELRVRVASNGSRAGAAPPNPAAADHAASAAHDRVDPRLQPVTAPAVGYFLYADGLGPGLAVDKGDALGAVDVLGVRHDPRSDLVGLGVVLYLLATGRQPFGEPRTIAQWRRRLYVAPAPPRRWQPGIPAWLQEIILHCLEVAPHDRYQSAAHVACGLRHPELVALTARAARAVPLVVGRGY